MPQIFDEEYEPRPWACDECKQVLGVVMRVIIPRSRTVGPRKVRRLWIFAQHCFSQPIPPTAVLRHPPRGLFKVHGVNSCAGVECGHCGALNEWSMSQEAYLELIRYYQGSDG